MTPFNETAALVDINARNALRVECGLVWALLDETSELEKYRDAHVLVDFEQFIRQHQPLTNRYWQAKEWALRNQGTTRIGMLLGMRLENRLRRMLWRRYKRT